MAQAIGGERLSLDLRLEEGLPAQEALRRAQEALRVGDVAARSTAYYLADLHEREGWTDLGCSSFKSMIEEKFSCAVGTARQYVRVGYKLRELPEIDALFLADRVCWTTVRSVAAKATSDTDGAWASFIVAHPPDEIEREADRRKPGEPPGGTKSIQQKDKGIKLLLRMSVLVYQLLMKAQAKLEKESGKKLGVMELIVHLVQLFLRSEADGTLKGYKPVLATHYLVHAVEGEGDTGWSIDAEGEPFPFSLSELRRHAQQAHAGAKAPEPPAEQKGVPADEEAPPIPLTEIGDTRSIDPRNNGPWVPEEERAPPTSPELRRKTLVRDKWRCLCCRSRKRLQAHHPWWRRYGGPTVLSNLMTLCIDCHSLVHARLLIVLGEPGAFRFLGSDGRPLGVRPRHMIEYCRLPRPIEERAHGREVPVEPPKVEVRLANLVGQREVLARVGVVIEAAKARGEQPGHMLFSGPPGLGKTTLADAVAGELEGSIERAPAPRVQTPEELINALRSVNTGGVLFIDELHALGERCAEVLYEALDKGVVSVPGGETIQLPRFTFVGATSEEGQLPRALRSRLIRERLGHYSREEIAELVTRAASRCGLELRADAAAALAKVSRDTPRDALKILQAVRDDATLAQTTVVEVGLVERTLARLEIDADGLDPLMRRYLGLLCEARGQAVSLCTIAAALGTSEEELRETAEPWLIRAKKIRITSRGRVLC